MAGSVVATAQAQDASDPFATGEEIATTYDADTDQTPVAKETDLWTLIHGAEYPQTEVLDGSLTTFDTELLGLSFLNRTVGLAGGSACERTPAMEPGEDPSAYGERASACAGTDGATVDRVPVLYRYVEPADDDPRWEKLPLPGGEEPGYVGAIAWIDHNRALIVGGTGTYPRRELGPNGEDQYGRSNAVEDPTEPAKADIAGKGRAWLYTRDQNLLEELPLDELRKDDPARAGMRGMSAVSCFKDPNPLPGEENPELCFAGALGQLWEWRDRKFSGKRIDAQSPPEDLRSARPSPYDGVLDRTSLIGYRVRDIEFDAKDPPEAVAVTAGCCSPGESNDVARALLYREQPSFNQDPPRWHSRELGWGPDVPDTAYSIFGGRYVASPGGPERAGERSSMLLSNGRANYSDLGPTAGGVPVAWGSVSRDESSSASATNLSTSRLVTASGDVGRDRSSARTPDGFPDWLMGELRSTRVGGLGARGLVLANAIRPGQEFVNTPTPENIAGWDAVNEETIDAHVRSSYYLLPSYSINAVEIVGEEEDGWAVGDHGAILRLNAEKLDQRQGALEPKPPRLGSARAASLADRGAYEQQAIPETAGSVPPLGAETLQLDEPEMTPSGEPGAGLDHVVTSRDGSEGWALSGDSQSGTRFYRLEGGVWTECDSLGIPGVLEPDPACAAMAPLRGFRDKDKTLRRIQIAAATRIPLENDPDPTNDDELEIVAVSNEAYYGPEYKNEALPTVIRYREGGWSFERPEAVRGLADLGSIVGMEFSSQDEGWIAMPGGQGTRAVGFFRYGDGRWMNCATSRLECGDPSSRIPTQTSFNGAVAGLARAGTRIYLYGNRVHAPQGTPVGTFQNVYPLILYIDPGGEWTDGAGIDNAGFDPAWSGPATEEAGEVKSLSVVEVDGGYAGWATGRFASGVDSTAVRSQVRLLGATPLLRLEPGAAGGWSRFRSPGAFEEYMLGGLFATPGVGAATPRSNSRLAVGYASEAGEEYGSAYIGKEKDGRVFGFDPARERFRMLQSARPQGNCCMENFGGGYPRPDGELQAMAGDGDGGFWAAVNEHFFHYTDKPPKPVFEEVPNPLGIREARLSDLDAGPDGSVWAATESERLFRHDRVTGWEEARIPGWDPGRVVTRASQVRAIAIGPGGAGLAVGEGGRIAEISSASVRLDDAAGTTCALDPPPCSTPRNLSAVDIAPDGSAIAGGQNMSLLWRQGAEGEFGSIPTPPIGSSANVTAVSHPTPTRVYVATDKGPLFRGDLADGAWRWQTDNDTPTGQLISVDLGGRALAIRDLAVDASGSGYAVGDQGLVLHHTPEGGWRRISAPTDLNLGSVALAPGGGEGVLIGGERGLVLTGAGAELSIARHAEFSGTGLVGTGAVRGIAYLPGSSEGSVDAWVGLGAIDSLGGRLLRHVSEPAGLDPGASAPGLPDAPPSDPAELSLAAFGKSDCERSERDLCPEMSATSSTNEVVLQRIVEELGGRREEGEVDLALFSGDAVDSGGRSGNATTNVDQIGKVYSEGEIDFTQAKHRRFNELVTQELEDEGLGMFSAIGSYDLSETYACDDETRCANTKPFLNAGENFSWREAFAGRTEPWGDGTASLGVEAQGEITFADAPGSTDNSLALEGHSADADGEGSVPEAKAEIGGANTHYAVDAVRDGEAIARIVFVDTSLRSLQASDPLQQPHELAGGQQRFLERMICKEGQQSTFGDGCTRGKYQRAIVVSNTPTYSYGPGALTHTALDGTTFEATMLRYDVDLVISGALGYNGLYYTLAPGVHEPCPAGEYPEGPPSGSTPDCLAGPAGPADEATKPAPVDPASLISEQGLSGTYPTLIASGAGGKFGPDGNEPPDGPAGQWHGYSIARLVEDGDIVIEQRPILDWVGLDALDHALPPRSRMKLNGYGRSPISTTTTGKRITSFHYEISTPAITHRYDLLLANPDEPWFPCDESDVNCQELHANLSKPNAEAETTPTATGEDNPCSPYLCLPARVGTVDDQTGQIRAGDGRYPETFAVAMLSVDERVATYPLVFKRSPSFVTSPSLRTGALPKLSGARPGAPPPPPPPPGLPQIPQVEIPQIPPPPGIPQLTAAAPPELQPPAPPAPPPPSQQPAPLDLSVAPPGVSISTPTALIQPPTPPVNPAPPGGARREARQRQAAAQKGGADSDASAGDANELGGDMADGREGAHGSSMTRRATPETARQDYSFTRLEERGGGASGLPIVAGLTLAAFAMAAGFSTLRPGPRRRTPELPAPAWNRRRG